MPFGLIIIGAVLAIVGIRGTYPALGSLLASDFTGATNFWAYIGGIAVVGLAGETDALRTPSRMMLGLIILVMLLSNQGFFAAFQQALQTNITPSPSPQLPVPTTTTGGAESLFGTLNSINTAGNQAAGWLGWAASPSAVGQSINKLAPSIQPFAGPLSGGLP